MTRPWGVMPDINVEDGQSPTSFIFMVGRKDERSEGYVVSVTRYPVGWRITRVGTYVE